MKKSLLSAAMGVMLLIGGGGAWAQKTYDNVAGTFSWAIGNEKDATASAEVADALLESSIKVGTDLTITDVKSANAGFPTLVLYAPTTSNAGCVTDDMVEFKVKMKKGLTFVPSNVEFDLVKDGTDNAYVTWSYTVDGVEGEQVAYSDPKTQIRRNNDGNPSAPITHNEKITSDGGREFSLRVYISNVANNKKMYVGNVKIHGAVKGTEIPRQFKDIDIDFTSDPYTVNAPADGLPADVKVEGTWHDAQHGYNTTTLTVPVDGPVRISFGKCQYGTPTATVKKGNDVLATVDCGGGCDGFVDYVYNSEEPTTLTIVSASYIPAIKIEACELLPIIEVKYYDTTGALLGVTEMQGGDPVKFAYTVADVTVPEGQAFRGWFASESVTALKIAEGTSLQESTNLYARATPIENVSEISRYEYDLTKQYFYIEDHEAIEIEGKYYNNHGWLVNSDGKISLKVAGKCYITVGNCQYSGESMAAINTNGQGKASEDEFQVKGASDGETFTFTYDGPATTVDITFPNGAYVHSVAVWHVKDFVEYNEASGYFEIPASDVSSLLLALRQASAMDGAKIFLPNGTYDLGETVLTNVSGKNISIIGESMTGTVIVNAPAPENEGIGTTATLLNTSENLYIQDLTIRNAMPFKSGEPAGRAVTLQDKGRNTICKNVSLESYQDTYYSNKNDAYFYFEDGEIHGVVDYVCGGGDVFFNRVKFVNEKEKNTTIAAPNGAKKIGYVMMDCEIETLCNEFNYGRAWGPYSGLAWINTTINQPEKLAKSRFTIAGMNDVADCFKEHNTKDASGKVISPASNVVEFTHSKGNKKYETILTADEVANTYALDKVFPDWKPAEIAAQAQYALKEDLAGNAYLVDGKIYYGELPAGENLIVRKANGRGGFGPGINSTTGSIDRVSVEEQEVVSVVYYNLQGVRVGADHKGVVVKVSTMSNGAVRSEKVVM